MAWNDILDFSLLGDLDRQEAENKRRQAEVKPNAFSQFLKGNDLDRYSPDSFAGTVQGGLNTAKNYLADVVSGQAPVDQRRDAIAEQRRIQSLPPEQQGQAMMDNLSGQAFDMVFPMAGTLGGKLAKNAPTGSQDWFKDPSGKNPVFEISDENLKFTGKGDNATGKISDFTEHPALFEQYPEIADKNMAIMNLPNSPKAGMYDPKTDTLYYNPQNTLGLSPEEVLAHEMNHIVQRVEGRPTGTSPEQVQQLLKANYNQNRGNPAEQKRLQQVDPTERYLNDFGEAESNWVQGRVNMTPKERAFDRDYPELVNPQDYGGMYQTLANTPDTPSMATGYRGLSEPKLVTDRPKTEFEKRFEVAQANAMLPKSEGGLELPTGNTAMDRAKAMGFDMDTDWYHGTTHDFNKFLGPDSPTASPEGHWGAGNYFTSDAYDASQNYAGVGPDLTGRIERRAEEIAGNNDWSYDDPRALKEATEELKGGAEGQVMPVMLRSEKPMNLTNDNPTRIGYDEVEIDDFIDDAKSEFDRDDYGVGDEFDNDAYYDDVYEKARELANEDAAYRDPEGPLAEVRDSLAYNRDLSDGSGAFDEAAENFELWGGGDVDARDFFGELRTKMFVDYDDAGNMIGPEAMAKSIEDAGFDSIKMDANEAFPNMDMDYGTQHQIVRDPNNIRSRFAAFDPKKKFSGDILATSAALGISIPMLMQMFEEQENKGL